LFIVLTFTIVLYAQGYSFDWQKKSLVATGAFYLTSYPKRAAIYINNEYSGETNKLIKRLLPQKYNVKISKPGYHDWQKTLEIKPGLVTTAKDILLIPKNPSVNQITNYNVKYSAISNDHKKIIYLTDRAIKEIDPTKQKIADPREVPAYSQFALRLIDLTDNTDIQINSSLPNLKNLVDISWSPNNKKLLLSFPYNYYYIFNLENPSKIIDLNNLIKVSSSYKIYNIKNALFHSQDPTKIYFLFNDNLFLGDLTGENPPINLASKILTYELVDDKIFYVSLTNHYVYKMNLDGSNKQKIVEIPAKIQEIQISNDNKKLFWKNKNEIGVVWLEPDYEQPARAKYDYEIIMKTLEDIGQVTWYAKSDQHIIFTIGNEIKISELDGRDQRNTANIITLEQPSKIFYNQWNEKLYVLSNEQLFEIDIK